MKRAITAVMLLFNGRFSSPEPTNHCRRGQQAIETNSNTGLNPNIFPVDCQLSLPILQALGQNEWMPRKDKDGIKVYSSTVPVQKYKPLK
jgi:hypothetical protein